MENPKAILSQISRESFKNVFFYGVGTVAVVAVSIYLSWWAGFLMFLVFTLLVIVSILQQLALLATNPVYLYGVLMGKEGAGGFADYGFLIAANLVQLIEVAILIVFNLVIYRTLYPLP